MAEKRNISSGAEKTEKLAKKPSVKAEENKEIKSLASNADKQKSNKKGVKKTNKNKNAKTQGARKKAEERKIKREEQKIEKKRIAAQRKQKKLEKKLEKKEKLAMRKAELKEKKLAAKAEKQKRRDALKNESKQQRQKRIAQQKKAKMEQKKHKRELAAQKRKQNQERRQNRSERKNRSGGFGGWLAAVISLGVTTLALGTVLTFGWMNYGNMQASVAGTYTQSLYELNAVVDDLNTDLARALASSSTHDMVKVFSDVATESRNAEVILEKFPLEIQNVQGLTSFINEVGMHAKGMLYTVADGENLSSRQQKALEYMYETNAKVKEQLNQMVSNLSQNDIISIMRGEDCAIKEGFTKIQNGVFGEDINKLERMPKTPAILQSEDEITPTQAESIALSVFANYGASQANCVGEATGILPLYNVSVILPEGELLAQISKNGGKLVAFDSFKECNEDNFSVDLCVDIAQEFLKSVGYNDLTPVWASENGTTCNLHFATAQGEVIIYSDLVKVKVCEQRGIVTGIDASGYILRHKARQMPTAKISKAEAALTINKNIDVSSTRLVMIPYRGREVLCYEFFGEMNGVEYYIYVDAQTGEEVEVKTVIGTAQGKLIR